MIGQLAIKIKAFVEEESRRLIVDKWSSNSSLGVKKKPETLSEEKCVCEFAITSVGDSIMDKVEQNARQREIIVSEREKRMEESIGKLRGIQANLQGLQRRNDHLESELSS